MEGIHRFPRVNILLLLIILDTFVRSYSSIEKTGENCEYKFESVEVFNHQDVFISFKLQGPILENQTLNWIAPHASWTITCNNSMQCTSNESSVNSRYRLTPPFLNCTFELLIASAQVEDSGQHIIILNEEGILKCTALIFSLSVIETKNNCTTLLDQHRAKVELSCQWTQISSNHHAELRAGHYLLAEDRSTGVNLNSHSNHTNEFSVYISIEDMINGNYVCVLVNAIGDVEETCAFLTPERNMVENNRGGQTKLDCCVENEGTRLIWWNNSSFDMLSLHDVSNNIAFVCLGSNNSAKPIIHNIVIVDFSRFERDHILMAGEYTSETKYQFNSTSVLRCETIIVNVTTPNLQSTTDQSSKGIHSPATSQSSPPIKSTSPGNVAIDMQILVAVAVPGYILSITIIVAALCFYSFQRKGKYLVREHRSNAALAYLAAEEDDDVDDPRPHDMITFSSQQHQEDMDISTDELVFHQQSTLDINIPDQDRVKTNRQDLRHSHSLLISDDMKDSYPGKCMATNDVPVIHSIGNVKGAGEPRNRDNVAKHSKDHLASKIPELDDVYSSIDDTSNTSMIIGRTKQPQKDSPILRPLQSTEDNEGDRLDVDKDNALPSPDKTPTPSEKDVGNQKPSARELEAMYAHPDMSKKTRNTGIESQSVTQSSQLREHVDQYGHDTTPTDVTTMTRDGPQDSLSQTDQHLYVSVPTKDFTSHTDDSDKDNRRNQPAFDSDLYINSSSSFL